MDLTIENGYNLIIRRLFYLPQMNQKSIFYKPKYKSK